MEGIAMAWSPVVLFSVGIIAFGASSAAAISVRFTSAATSQISADERQVIERVATDTMVEARLHLHGLGSDVVLVVDTGTDVIEQTGETGVAVAAGLIRWTVNPNMAGGAGAIATAHLRQTLLHESHHLARGWVVQGRAPSTSFMDAVV